MANWSLPTIADLYANIIAYLNNRLNDAALWFDSSLTSPTNHPTGTKRWNNSSSKFEKWNGSAWEDLAATYSISISGNAATATTCSGNAATASNASQLEGHAASYFQVALGFTPVNKAGDTMTGDLTVYRTATPTVGNLYLGNTGTRYLGFDGSAYNLPGAELTINGGTALRSNNVKTIGGNSLQGTGDIAISTKQIQTISASVASNALTLTINPTSLDFRASTLTSGTVNTRSVGSAISLVVTSGATLGTTNAVAARLAILAIDNAGTVELAVCNLKGCPNLDETTLISTTAMSASASSTGVIYSTTARTGVPFRVVGFVDITEATAGTWATPPTKVQGAGGQSLGGMSGIGYGQTWQDVKASRALGTTYYNTTNRPIAVACWCWSSGQIGNVSGTVDGVVVMIGADYGTGGVSFTVPPGSSYSCYSSQGLSGWAELR